MRLRLKNKNIEKKKSEGNSSVDDNEVIDIKLWDKSKMTTSGFGLWISQLKTILNKNIKLHVIKYWKTAICLTIVMPLLTMILLKFVVYINLNMFEKENKHPEKYPLSGLNDCEGPIGDKDSCINIMYTNCIDYANCPKDATIDTIMSSFIERNNERMNLNWNTNPNNWENWDEKKLDFEVNERHDVIHVPNSGFIYDYVLQHQNRTHFGIVFDIKREAEITNYRYQVWFNGTLNSNNTDLFGSRVISVARGIDEAIVSFANGDPNIKATFDIDLKDFPTIATKGIDDTIISQFGPTFFFCVSMVIFINMLNVIVSEKESKVRFSMEMMGLKKSVYWLSWCILYFFIILLNSLFTILFGKLFNYSFFTNTNFLVLFMLFFTFGLALGSLGLFFTTLVNKSRTAVLLGISLLIIGFLIQSFLFSNEYLGYVWWSSSVPQLIRKLFTYLIPFFNFGKMFIDINSLSTSTINYITDSSVDGPGFFLKNLNQKPESEMGFILNLKYMEKTINSFYYMLLNIGIYFVLTMYLDNVIPNEYGNRLPLYYFLQPSYWGFGKAGIETDEEWIEKTKKANKPKIFVSELDDDVQRQYKYTNNSEKNRSPIKILNIHKSFGYGKKKKNVIKNTSLSFDESKVVALLGQNGAGKSTTINILSGLTPASSGDMFVYGKSLKRNISGVQSELGICPQHDILYKDLSALEHLRLYSGIKGAKQGPELDEILINRLKAVRLYTVKDANVDTYSGGMKRRLSMVIATIGDPNVILLDEPTTGMDPLNRRHVWEFIEQFKKNRCVLLTTHSMEEADALGDDIVIMSEGVIKAIGNGIHLKNKFGKGYRISIVTNPENMSKVKSIVKSMVPGIHLADDSAGSLIYDFTTQQSKYIPLFVKYLDTNSDGLINNWGISQTTLEEVFLIVIQENSNRKIIKEE